MLNQKSKFSQVLAFAMVLLMIFTVLPTVPVSAATTIDLIWPCESTYEVSCIYYYKTGEEHLTKYGYKTSIDICGAGNILAAESGTVTVVKDLGNESFGKYVIIQHDNGEYTLYAHLNSYSVSVGDTVDKGDTIGVMGASGNASGVHLHFEYSGGDPWKDVYHDKYAENIVFQPNVRSNNEKYNSDKTIVDIIDKYYVKNSDGNYVYNSSANVGADTWYQDYNPNYNSEITPKLIQSFLESYPGGLSSTTLADGMTVLDINGTYYDLGFDSYYAHTNTIDSSNPLKQSSTGKVLTPAQIIYYACVENDMNVVWILANLQKEQSLIGSIEDNYQTCLNRAAGYMKFENGERSHYEADEKYYGFIGQVIGATYQFSQYIKDGTTTMDGGYEKYTPSEESGNMTFSDFKTKIYDKYTVWFDDNINESSSGEATEYLDDPIITSPSTSDTYIEGENITFAWNSVDSADHYTIGVKDETSGETLTAELLGRTDDDDNIVYETSYTLNGEYAIAEHQLKFAVGACSDDGNTSAGWSSVTITVGNSETELPDVVTYTITYDANGGIDAPPADTKLEDVGINLNGAGPTREGYTCIGWSTAPDATEAEYALGEVYDVNEDITLYAVWKEDAVVRPDVPDIDYGTVINSGVCGDALIWTMHDSGTLVVSGKGDMATLGGVEYPWYTYMLKITKVVFDEGVTSIANNAFNNYDLLKEITFNDSITSIGAYAFRDCDTLTNIEIPDSVTSIGEYAFKSCDALANVYMGKSVTSIGEHAFEDCTKLSSIYYFGNAPTGVGYKAFYNISAGAIIYYIEGATRWTDPWNGYTTAIFVPEDPTVAVTGVSLSSSAVELSENETYTITATVAPADATDKSVTWTSSNKAVATVENGKVTAVGGGTTVIIATTVDGGYTATCIVTVEGKQEITKDPPVIEVSDVRGNPGGTITVSVVISNNPGFTSMTLNVEYDESIFTLTNVIDSGLIPGAMHTERYSSPYILTWDNDTVRENYTVNGTIAELVFSVAEEVELGEYTIGISYPQDGIFDAEVNEVEFHMQSGTVTISNVIIGDVTGDGVLTNKDRVYLARYLAGWEGYDESVIDKTAADVNCDGVLTNKDRVYLARHLAGWDGYETLPIT